MVAMKRILLTFLLLLIPAVVQAQLAAEIEYYAGHSVLCASYSWNVASGNWGTATCWSPSSGYPSAAADVAILNKSSGTCNLGNSYSIGQLQITASNVLTQQSGNNTLTLSTSTAVPVSCTTLSSTAGGINVSGGTLALNMPNIEGASGGITGGSNPVVVTGGLLAISGSPASGSSGNWVLGTNSLSNSGYLCTGGTLQATSGNANMPLIQAANVTIIAAGGGGNLSLAAYSSSASIFGSLSYTNALIFSSSGALIITGSMGGSGNCINFNAPNSVGSVWTGGLYTSANAGTVYVQSGSLTWNPVIPAGGASIVNTTAGGNHYPPIFVTGGTLAINGPFSTSVPSGILDYYGPVLNSSGTIVWTGSGTMPAGTYCNLQSCAGNLILGTSANPLSISNSGAICVNAFGSTTVTASSAYCKFTNSSGSAQTAGLGFYLPVTNYSSGSGTGGTTVTISSGGTMSSGTLALTGGTSQLSNWGTTSVSGSLFSGILVGSSVLSTAGTLQLGTTTITPSTGGWLAPITSTGGTLGMEQAVKYNTSFGTLASSVPNLKGVFFGGSPVRGVAPWLEPDDPLNHPVEPHGPPIAITINNEKDSWRELIVFIVLLSILYAIPAVYNLVKLYWSRK
jgi:hypothetical protein